MRTSLYAAKTFPFRGFSGGGSATVDSIPRLSGGRGKEVMDRCCGGEASTVHGLAVRPVRPPGSTGGPRAALPLSFCLSGPLGPSLNHIPSFCTSV